MFELLRQCIAFPFPFINLNKSAGPGFQMGMNWNVSNLYTSLPHFFQQTQNTNSRRVIQ